MTPRLPSLIENAVTGDRIQFLNSPLHGDAGPLVFRTTLAPRAAGSPLHVHTNLDERFEVERGEMLMEVGGRGAWQRLGGGDAVDMPCGTAHSFRNDLDEPVVFLSTVSPGTGFEKFLRSIYGLANDGRTNAGGMPRDPRALALVLEYAELVIPGVPRWLQSGALKWLTIAARKMGVETSFAPYFGGPVQ
jgi:mannose-6-phosphate isomerase-like protein (cupin superfamily)